MDLVYSPGIREREQTGMKNLLLTGRPGIGKTTVVRKLIEKLDVPTGGFYTEEIRTGNTRAGFRVVDLEGPHGLLAHVDRKKISTSEGRQPPRVGKYHVDVRSFDAIGVPALEGAISAGNLVVVDEIGRMELFSERFQSAVVRALDAPNTMVAVIQQRPDSLLNQIRARSDVHLLTVTLENRDSLPAELATMLRATP
jgi:nucleoside-triphosphatase